MLLYGLLDKRSFIFKVLHLITKVIQYFISVVCLATVFKYLVFQVCFTITHETPTKLTLSEANEAKYQSVLNHFAENLIRTEAPRSVNCFIPEPESKPCCVINMTRTMYLLIHILITSCGEQSGPAQRLVLCTAHLTSLHILDDVIPLPSPLLVIHPSLPVLFHCTCVRRFVSGRARRV